MTESTSEVFDLPTLDEIKIVLTDIDERTHYQGDVQSEE